VKNLTITEEELFGALLELTEASQAMVEAQHGNDKDIWAISDRYDDAVQRARMVLARVSRAG
jgi:hypothetical protein